MIYSASLLAQLVSLGTRHSHLYRIPFRLHKLACLPARPNRSSSSPFSSSGGWLFTWCSLLFGIGTNNGTDFNFDLVLRSWIWLSQDIRIPFWCALCFQKVRLSPSRVTPFARALIEEWQYRFGLALSLLSEGSSYEYENLLDSFYLPVSIFGSRGSQVSIQM